MNDTLRRTDHSGAPEQPRRRRTLWPRRWTKVGPAVGLATLLFAALAVFVSSRPARATSASSHPAALRGVTGGMKTLRASDSSR